MPTPLVVVVGSVGMDLLVRVSGLPAPGRAVAGGDLLSAPGGHGGTLAVAAARLGANVHLVARVGADDLGSRLLASLDGYCVSTTFVTVTESVATATTLCLADASTGFNASVVSPGANARLSPEDIDRAAALIRTASVVLLPLDVPGETVAHTVRLCHRHRVPIVADPAGVTGTVAPDAFSVSLLTASVDEAMGLLGLGDVRNQRPSAPDPKQLAADLLARGPGAVVLKLADSGALYAAVDNGVPTFLAVPAFKVKVKDPGGAGDAFTAALALARAEGKAPADALRFANAAGALACTHPGVQSALPARPDVDDILRRWT